MFICHDLPFFYDDNLWVIVDVSDFAVPAVEADSKIASCRIIAFDYFSLLVTLRTVHLSASYTYVNPLVGAFLG